MHRLFHDHLPPQTAPQRDAAGDRARISSRTSSGSTTRSSASTCRATRNRRAEAVFATMISDTKNIKLSDRTSNLSQWPP